MNWLPKFSVERPVTVSMLFLALCVLGMIAWARIPLELFPSSFFWVFIVGLGAFSRFTATRI